MHKILFVSGVLLSLLLPSGAQALALGPKEFAAAKTVACVMAQDSLGYLSENDFNDLVDQALADFEDDAADVIYAKAVGYFDGLMFGIPESDQELVQARLRQFNASRVCTRLVSSSFQL
ncbi:hypothetical protein [Chromatocurvus halotolerans]|uniref:Uncharacterized protein n=1 Tax=Chromatocurvus halotolerans TaxID=1132028 RepID=A0A4R2KWL3_9GAMM|nr:hypothetical protein [Chromatocurvus halotolerans]TCO75636.1 hypothetical protein EV688_10753 [Chromatocurvus halotolerans]